jgi:hypothetical protein
MRKIIIAGFILAMSCRGFSQLNNPYAGRNEVFTGTEKQQLKHIDSVYLAESGYGREFINGRDYIKYYYRAGHKPVLYPERERTASLTYKGRVYKDLVLQYDTYLDQVIYGDNNMVFNNKVHQVALNGNNINQFVLCFDNDTLTFRHITDGSGKVPYPEPGFYEIVYDGRCKYLIKHKSELRKLNGTDEYIYNPSGFVMVGAQFTRITSRKQFVSLFGTSSREISKYIRAQGINIRKADKHRITDILRFYESISTGSL